MRLEGCGRDTTSHSRGAMRPSLAKILTPRRSEGAGNAGRAMRPKPRMQNKTSIRVSHHGHTGTTRHSPRNGFTAYFALSSVTTLFDTVACASYRRLDANDWGVRTTRLRRTQADRVRLARCRVHRIPPRVDDVAQRPLHWDGTRESVN